MTRKTITSMAAALSLAALLSGCGSGDVDATTSATAELLPLAEDVNVRAGTDPDGEVLLDGTTIQGIMASDHYDTGTSSPYAYALVLSGEGKKQFRNATRELAKDQSQITVWAGDQAICSPTITSMLNTNFVILNVASVTDDESYQAVLDALCAPSAE